MYYTIYKITNLIDGSVYIGCHNTRDLNDGFMGSGMILKAAQEKYGIKNFRKSILKVYTSPEEMFGMDSELVNANIILKPTPTTKNSKKLMWIYSPKEGKSKRINKEEFLVWETKGWIKGRK